MKACERSAVETIGAMLDAHSIPWRLHRGGKHLAVIATMTDGSNHKFPVSGSPRADADAQRNWCRQHVNAWFDRVGIGSGRGLILPKPQKRRRKTRTRSTIQRIEVAVEPTDGPGRDPWAALAARA